MDSIDNWCWLLAMLRYDWQHGLLWLVVVSKMRNISCLVLTSFLSFSSTTSTAALSRTVKMTGSEYTALSSALYSHTQHREWVYCLVLGFIFSHTTWSEYTALSSALYSHTQQGVSILPCPWLEIAHFFPWIRLVPKHREWVCCLVLGFIVSHTTHGVSLLSCARLYILT